MELLYSSNYGYEIYRNQKQDTVWVQFDSPRLVVGNAALNGGIHTGIKTMFNHTLVSAQTAQDLPGGSMADYLQLVATDNGLDPQTATGLLTAARMVNCSVQHINFKRLEVAAAVTAGVDVNAGRAGDPAAYYERDGKFQPLGTINILLMINANLPHPSLIKSIITATEAKTAALQELMVPGQYSAGLATGTGTDGIMVAADPNTDFILTDTGLHSKLGELIGRVTKAGVKEALARENKITATRQNNLLIRLSRFGITENYLWSQIDLTKTSMTKQQFSIALEQIARDPALVTITSALLHLQDELNWGLLSPKSAAATCVLILNTYAPGITMPTILTMPDNQSDATNQPVVLHILTRWINNLVSDKVKTYPDG